MQASGMQADCRLRQAMHQPPWRYRGSVVCGPSCARRLFHLPWCCCWHCREQVVYFQRYNQGSLVQEQVHAPCYLLLHPACCCCYLPTAAVAAACRAAVLL